MTKPRKLAGRRLIRPATGRRERHRAEIRDRIFRSALELFAERGFLETTVEDITETADVGKGTFFNYFPTKEHVLATLGAERLALIERAHERAQKGPVLPALRDMAIEVSDQSYSSPALLRAIYAAHASCEPVREELLKRLQTGRRLLAEIYRIGQSRGEVRSGQSPEELARLTQIVVLGVILAWAMNPDSSLRKTTEEVWDLFSADLRADHNSSADGRKTRS